MNKKQEKIFVLVAAVVVIVIFIFVLEGVRNSKK